MVVRTATAALDTYVRGKLCMYRVGYYSCIAGKLCGWS